MEQMSAVYIPQPEASPIIATLAAIVEGGALLCFMSPPGTALYRSIVCFDYIALHNEGQTGMAPFRHDTSPLVAVSSLSTAVRQNTRRGLHSKTDCIDRKRWLGTTLEVAGFVMPVICAVSGHWHTGHKKPGQAHRLPRLRLAQV
ncbi:hypothetical protein [Novosphingobium sp.]|uniref:hypothetical protein n=1 Tax=Novosphingobium sp. TaxID=1874826 RepID=UPI0028A6DD5B|nr:hypothetical protein [Novosphingobium sp.]